VHPHETTKVIKDFPKAHDAFAYEQTRVWCARGLENCVQIRCCALTKDGSITFNVLKSLGKCPELTDIAINGNHSGLYEPGDLLQLLHLHKISLIGPTRPILEILPTWFQATGKSLTTLALMCEARQSSMRVLDALFIHTLGGYEHHRCAFELYLTVPFAARASSHRRLPKSDPRRRLVGDKQQDSRLEGTEPRSTFPIVREYYATIFPRVTATDFESLSRTCQH
jgi:hypothetical protein